MSSLSAFGVTCPARRSYAEIPIHRGLAVLACLLASLCGGPVCSCPPVFWEGWHGGVACQPQAGLSAFGGLVKPLIFLCCSDMLGRNGYFNSNNVRYVVWSDRHGIHCIWQKATERYRIVFRCIAMCFSIFCT